MALYTLEEIETEITRLKSIRSALTHQRSVRIGDKEYTARDIPEVVKELEWFDLERQKLTATGGAVAPAVGRTYARNGRSCR